MKAIITGANGTVGSALSQYLGERGDTPVPWNRAFTPIDDYAAMEKFVLEQQPDAIFHLAVASQATGRENESWWVNYHWTSELAWICRVHRIRFVYTSTVMVYSDDARGPFTPETLPDAVSGYGFDKLQAERRASEQNPDSIIARLGWQIGSSAGSNNMIDFFERQMGEHGMISASRRWLPACSFVEDTAAALVSLLDQPGGVYLVNSNLRWTFYDIASALNARHGSTWSVQPSADYVYDQRMIDPRVTIAPLNQRLPDLI